MRNISGGRKSICAIGIRPILSPGNIGIFSVYSHRLNMRTPNRSTITAMKNAVVSITRYPETTGC